MSSTQRAIMGAIAGIGMAGALLFNPAVAQEYPARPVRLLIPFAPGGTTDVFARKYAERMSREGVQMIPENKAGASGAIAAAEVARATPDGHTLFFATSSTVAILPLMDQKTPYDIDKDFAHISLIGITSHLISVNPNFPAKSLPELVALLKASPGKYSYGHSGVGGPTHLAGELFKSLAGVNIIDVPYKGSAPALVDAIAGIHPVFIDGFVTIVPQHRSGKMRVLAQLAETRSKILSDIPTSAEAGLPGFTSGSFMVVMAPVKTPQGVQRTLESVTAKVVRDTAFQAEMLNVYIDPVTDSTPEKIRALIARERAKWGPIIKATGAKMQ